MNKELKAIRYQLTEISEAMSNKLYRLAWRMQAHGCSQDSIKKCREEATALHTGEVEQIIDPFKVWEYAFKF